MTPEQTALAIRRTLDGVPVFPTGQREAVRNSLEEAAERLGMVFQQGNPGFHLGQFMAACGFPDY